MRIAAALLLLVTACEGGSTASFCERAEEFEQSALGADPEADLEAEFTKALETLDALVETAPAEIVTDLTVVRDDLDAFARGTGGLGPDYRRASQRVREFLSSECSLPGPEGSPVS